MRKKKRGKEKARHKKVRGKEVEGERYTRENKRRGEKERGRNRHPWLKIRRKREISRQEEGTIEADFFFSEEKKIMIKDKRQMTRGERRHCTLAVNKTCSNIISCLFDAMTPRLLFS